MNLPALFCDNMKSLLDNEYDDFIKSYFETPLSGLRVNTNRISVEDFIRIAPFPLEGIPFINNGFYINDADAWSKHPYYYAGLYYLQEPSAMLPANRLIVKKTDKVLDLCAAPGGKATELSSRCDLLIANDISFTRTIPLVKNLEISGANKLYVCNEDPSKLSIYYKNYFDCILLDVPCSGEGMFRKDPNLIKSWLEKGPLEYVEVQKSILNEALKMLKPGGYILYSTCTFSPLETEEIIFNCISENSDISLLEIEEVEGMLSGYRKYVDKDERFNRCYHILPHRTKGEGHFLALMQKKCTSNCDDEQVGKVESSKSKKSKNNNRNKSITYDRLPDVVKDFLEDFSFQTFEVISQSSYLIDDKGLIYMLPLGYEEDFYPGIHYVRTGTIVGQWDKKGKFKPHTAFALWADNNSYKNVCDFSCQDPMVVKYLKGETLILDDNYNEIVKSLEKGYCIVSVDGFYLGFAKYDGGKLKNLYETGWRMT